MADLKDEIASILKTKAQADVTKVEGEDRDRSIVENFFKSAVSPAFSEFSDALQANGRTVETNVGKTSASLLVRYQGAEELNFRIENKTRLLVSPIVALVDPTDGKRFTAEGHFQAKSGKYTADGITKDDILNHLLKEYRAKMTGR